MNIRFSNYFSIKKLLWIYILFTITLFFSLLILNVVNTQYITNNFQSNLKIQLNLMNNSLDRNLNSIQTSLLTLAESNSLKNYGNTNDPYLVRTVETIRQEENLVREMKTILNSSRYLGAIDLYTPTDNKIISTRDNFGLDRGKLEEKYQQVIRPGWYNFGALGYYYVTMYPFRSGQKITPFHFFLAGKLQQDFLYNHISDFDPNRQVTNYLSLAQNQIVSSKEVDEEVEKSVAGQLKKAKEIQTLTVESADGPYRVWALYNSKADGFLISYYNARQFLAGYQPVTIYFSSVLSLLLLFAIFISALFYFRVYRNMKLLTHSFHLIEKGDLSIRIQKGTESDFSYVFKQFNEMMNHTEVLVEQVTKEANLRQLAELKQLQAQIDPHFLYNSLFFIMSMANQSPEAVISMSENLAEYYRYRTKKGVQEVTVSDELTFVEHYLNVMVLRKKIHYSIHVSDEILNHPLPILMLQPIVENAIYHGLEGRQNAHQIKIVGTIHHNGFDLFVTDDGKGLSDEELVKLKASLREEKPDFNRSVGLWNIHHRLINLFGQDSGLQFKQETPGLTVYFWVPFLKEESHL